MAGEVGQKRRSWCGDRRITMSGIATVSNSSKPSGTKNRTLKPWALFPGILRGSHALVQPMMLLAMVNLTYGLLEAESEFTILEHLIVRGRCQARCNGLYGYQQLHQIDLFDHYPPFVCKKGNHLNCSECSQACMSGRYDPFHCNQLCRTEVCESSCDFLHMAFTEENDLPGQPSVQARNLSRAASRLTWTRPTPACTYTPLHGTFTAHKSLVRVYWNVRDITNTSTTLPLTFIMAIQSCGDVNDCPGSSTWKFFSKPTNFSVIPVSDLAPNTTYVIKVLAVHWSGYIAGSAVSDPITTPPVSETLGVPVNLTVSQQYVRGGTLRAVLSWASPPVTGGCYFKIYCMPPTGSYDLMEVKDWGQLRYELKKLIFNSVYEIQMYNFDEEFLVNSQPATLSFRTLTSCVEITNDYNVCPPEKPSGVLLSSSLPYTLNNTEQAVCDLFVSWDPPRYTRHRNVISNYSLTFRKAPDMHFAHVIQPHRGSAMLSASATNYTIRKCHWDGVYEVHLVAQSPAGRSEAAIVSISLGGGYSFYYESVDQDKKTNNDKGVLYAIAAPLLLGVLAIVVCLLYCWRIGASSVSWAFFGQREEINPLYRCTANEEADELIDDKYEIDFSALQFIETLGEGAFGKVLKAELDLSLAPIGDSCTGHMTVAAKVLKDHATPDERRNLLLEIEAMKQLGQHQNLVSIIGCVTSSKRPCLVMNYCPLGDLRAFLRNSRKQRSQSSRECAARSTCRRGQLNSGDSCISEAFNFHCTVGNASSLQFPKEEIGAVEGVSPRESSNSTEADDLEVVSQTKLLSFARQIARGMEYLVERKFIHRDLAARNILLYSHQQLKISDFGLARDVYETNMYQTSASRKLPYKWMPIESIFNQIFTHKSDVWSFGIVLWEIVTLGGCPYPGIPNKDLFRLLQDGYRMEKPENCSLEIYKIMLSCWHPRPEDRPTFTELRNTLERSLEKARSYIDLSITISEDYYRQEDLACSDSNSLGSAEASNHDRCGGLTMQYTDEPSTAATHVCHLFHNNSSDKNLTLGRAESVTLEAPSSLPERVLTTENQPRVKTLLSDPAGSDVWTRRCEGENLRKVKSEKAGSSRQAVGTHEVSCRQSEQPTDVGNQQQQQSKHECESDTSSQGLTHSARPSPVESGSSSTERTCGYVSADDLSDISESYGPSQQVKGQSAFSLTSDVLNFVHSGKNGMRNSISNHQRHHYHSLTDLNGLGIEMDSIGPSCPYNRGKNTRQFAL